MPYIIFMRMVWLAFFSTYEPYFIGNLRSNEEKLFTTSFHLVVPRAVHYCDIRTGIW